MVGGRGSQVDGYCLNEIDQGVGVGLGRVVGGGRRWR